MTDFVDFTLAADRLSAWQRLLLLTPSCCWHGLQSAIIVGAGTGAAEYVKGSFQFEGISNNRDNDSQGSVGMTDTVVIE